MTAAVGITASGAGVSAARAAPGRPVRVGAAGRRGEEA
jgi:hypothetical protein